MQLSELQRSVIGEGRFEKIAVLPFDESIRILDEEGGAMTQSAIGVMKNDFNTFLMQLFESSATLNAR
jgi:hypothetical protein